MTLRPLFQNLQWKLLAVLIALLLWAAFVGSPELVTSVSAPIQFENMPPNLEMGADTPGRIYLEVQGPSSRLRGIEPARNAVVLNLSNVRGPGEYTFTVQQNNTDLPAGLKLMRAVPGQVRLRFEYRVAADVAVRARFSSPPPEGYRIGNQEVVPKTLRIIGPETRVKQIGYVETDPIDLSRVQGKAQIHVHAFLPDPQVRFESAPAVEVTITLEKTVDGAAAIRN
jgi:YbbR domain-containing protein